MKYTFISEQISCGHCKMRIEKALNEAPGITQAEVDVEKKQIFLESTLPSDEIVGLIDEAGYDARLA